MVDDEVLALAADVVASPLVPAFDRQIPVDTYAVFLEDPSNEWDIDRVSHPDHTAEFSARSGSIFNEGMSHSTWWVKLTLDRAIKTTSEADRILLVTCIPDGE